MFFVLAVVYLSQGSIHAAPVSAFIRDAHSQDSSSTTSCSCPDQQRSIWDILWSCIATIVACSWLSVHPNMPTRGEKWWKIALNRLELMFWALIAPEMAIVWAMRQWFAARYLAKLYQCKIYCFDLCRTVF
jgi:hypothetical protein